MTGLELLYWLVLVGLPAAVGWTLATVAARRVGTLGAGLGVVVFPTAFALVAWLAYEIWNPDRGCSEECWGFALYGIAWFGASLGAEIALIGVLLDEWVRARRRRGPGPRGSSP